MPESDSLQGASRASEGTAARPATWTVDEVVALFDQPFNDLLFRAAGVHRQNFDPNSIQISTLMSIKTGGCPEDCAYCAQSSRYQTGLAAGKLVAVKQVAAAAKRAKASGATRFCMGAAWRELRDRDMDAITAMIAEVKSLGLETCVTLGMVKPDQARRLKAAGLDYYNHNVDTSAEFYAKIITTRIYQDRLDTLSTLRAAEVKLCSGGILGMGEGRRDRAAMLATLANLHEPPESVPINLLIPIAGTPLEDAGAIDPLEFVRSVAVARILMPRSVVRLSAGREAMTDSMQALCFFAGANSIFLGEKLLTAANADAAADEKLFQRLGLRARPAEAAAGEA